MAPIDPVQLLKALAPLLSESGGIIDLERATQFASLMKKFSKKLVSRCVYCNVLKATVPAILSRFLEEGGWETINNWLNDAKENSNMFFLLELLQLCKVLPMTLERLRENNTPKLVKALTKYDHSEIRTLSNELVTTWMTIIKGNDPPVEAEKKEKKRKTSTESNKEQKDPKKISKVKGKEPSLKDKKVVKTKDKKDVKTAKSDVVQKTDKKATKATASSKTDGPKSERKSIKATLPQKAERPSRNGKELPKNPEKPKATKRLPNDKDSSKSDTYEDVKIKVDAEPAVKKPKLDRPKTVKSYQAKFRATGLEEEVPLPKKVPKKTTTVDKSAAAAVAKSAAAKRLNTASNDRITEKKIKPESLMAINESQNSNGGIKLIPAKPRPTHILHESASFIDALCATPAALPKRKKKIPPKPAPPAPPSPTLQPPKLQFYKDTLEMNTEESDSKADTKDEKTVVSDSPSSPPKEETGCTDVKSEGDTDDKSQGLDAVAIVEESINKQITDESKDLVIKEDEEEEEKEEKVEEEVTRVPGQLVSILAHGKRRHRRKSVRWVDDEDLKQVFYFELDETERVNVLRNRTFGDLKSIEAKREREAFEAAKRQAGDKMEESIPWWTVPILIDVPPPLVVPGCYSQEREIQLIRQQSILSEIYFTREMIPDSPHEPDIEITAPHEPKLIPLDEENVVGSIIDYSSQEIPKPKSSLPQVLSTLMKISTAQPSILGQLPIDQGLLRLPTSIASPTSPYDPGEPVSQSLLGAPPNIPPMYNMQPPLIDNKPETMPLANNWGPMDANIRPPDPYYQNFPMNQNSGMDGIPPMMPNDNMRMRGGGPIMGRDMYRGSMMRPPYPMNRPSGPRPNNRRTVPCRHFIAGNCRFGAACSFLHPGVNGPLL